MRQSGYFAGEYADRRCRDLRVRLGGATRVPSRRTRTDPDEDHPADIPRAARTAAPGREPTRLFRRGHGARGQRIAVTGGKRAATRHARGVGGRGTALVSNSAGERPTQCRGFDRAGGNLPTSRQQPVVGRAASRGNRLRPGPRGGGDRARDRSGAQRRALCTRHVVLGCRTAG